MKEVELRLDLEGSGRQMCSMLSCGRRSLQGLRKGYGFCPYHWALKNWGKEWADNCYPGYTPKMEKS